MLIFPNPALLPKFPITSLSLRITTSEGLPAPSPPIHLTSPFSPAPQCPLYLLSLLCALSLLSFIQSTHTLKSHPDNHNMLLDSSCPQTPFPKIHSYHCLHYHDLTLLSHQLQKYPHTLGFPAFLAWCATTFISYALAPTGLHPTSGADHVFSHPCSHCAFSWNSLSSCESLPHSSETRYHHIHQVLSDPPKPDTITAFDKSVPLYISHLYIDLSTFGRKDCSIFWAAKYTIPHSGTSVQ